MATWDKLRSSGQSADVKRPVYNLLDEILGTSPCTYPMNFVEIFKKIYNSKWLYETVMSYGSV